MKNSIIILLSLCTFRCIALEIEGTKIESKILDLKVTSAQDSIFPEKCLGVWEGIMYIFHQGVLRDSVKVRFTAAKTATVGAYTWKTEYLSTTTPMVKDYKLILDNLNEGRYILDEGDGVKLVEYSVNNKLYGLFKVDDIYLTSSTELVDNKLIVEVTSGNEITDNQGIKSYSFTNVQRMVLIKLG